MLPFRRFGVLAARSWLGLLGLILAVPLVASGAQFSALLMLKDGQKVMPGKIYVRDDMMRQEFTDEEGQTITIVRRDKKVIWVILPQQRTYMELPLKTRLPGQFIQIPPNALQKRLVGKDRVCGYEAEKYEVTVPGGSGLEKQTIWVVPKLGLPVKLVCTQRNFSLEYKSIREGPVPERLFALPQGYQRLTTMKGFSDRLEE
jgi:outer membrane lipoprotein-sorting protein